MLGGGAGGASTSIRVTGAEKEVLPAFSEEVIAAGQKIEFTACGGGGYGDPLARDPARVAGSVNRGWLDPETAREVYRVALVPGDAPDLWTVDVDETARLRAA